MVKTKKVGAISCDRPSTNFHIFVYYMIVFNFWSTAYNKTSDIGIASCAACFISTMKTFIILLLHVRLMLHVYQQFLLVHHEELIRSD